MFSPLVEDPPFESLQQALIPVDLLQPLVFNCPLFDSGSPPLLFGQGLPSGFPATPTGALSHSSLFFRGQCHVYSAIEEGPTVET